MRRRIERLWLWSTTGARWRAVVAYSPPSFARRYCRTQSDGKLFDEPANRSYCGLSCVSIVRVRVFAGDNSPTGRLLGRVSSKKVP